MLKWTVKKRLAGEDNGYEIGNIASAYESDRKTYVRRSLGSRLVERRNSTPNVLNKRCSLGNLVSKNIDKENDNEKTPARKGINIHNSTPLNDRSNVYNGNQKRSHQMISSTPMSSPLISPISVNSKQIIVENTQVLFPMNFAPTLPSFDVEYSPLMKANMKHLAKIAGTFIENPRYFNSNLRNISDDEHVPAKRLKVDFRDVSYEFKPESRSTSSPLSTPLTQRKSNVNGNLLLDISHNSNQSFNSSEVGDTTLQKIIDDILASAKHGNKFQKHPVKDLAKNRDRNANFLRTLEETCENLEEKSIMKLWSTEKLANAADQTIIIANENTNSEREVKSPAKEDIEISDFKTDTCYLKRQNAVRRKNTSNENKKRKIFENLSQKTLREINDSTIQKCLSFASTNYDDLSDKFKISSVASNSSSASSNSNESQTKNAKIVMKGSIELAIKVDNERKRINIHVVKCKNLHRDGGINAYVKCALIQLKSAKKPKYQRTGVHKNSRSPTFDHKFLFDFTEEDTISLAVWHRNRNMKRSEFLGCLTVSVQNALENDILGTFLLQPQSYLTNQSAVIPGTIEQYMKFEETFRAIQNDNDDDNALLKYLELNENHCLSGGRTPFTLTVIEKRNENHSFGLTITDSSPPKIEATQSQSKLQRGDYIIFIENINIVSMPIRDILGLINSSHKEMLTLEIFRPIENVNSNVLIENLAALNTPKVHNNYSPLDLDSTQSQSRTSNNITETPKRHIAACHFKQPKICFQPTIGNGVIV